MALEILRVVELAEVLPSRYLASPVPRAWLRFVALLEAWRQQRRAGVLSRQEVYTLPLALAVHGALKRQKAGGRLKWPLPAFATTGQPDAKTAGGLMSSAAACHE